MLNRKYKKIISDKDFEIDMLNYDLEYTSGYAEILQMKLDSAIDLVNNVYSSLINVDRLLSVLDYKTRINEYNREFHKNKFGGND